MSRQSSNGREANQGQEGSFRVQASHDQLGTHGHTVPPQQHHQPNGSAYNSQTSSHGSAQQYDASRHWHAVPRPWGFEYADDRHVAPGHSSAGGQSFALNSPYYSQGHTNTRPLTQGNGNHTRASQSTEASAPRLTHGNLQQLDRDRRPTDNMALWRGEDQRESAWNGVGYVRLGRDDRSRNG